MVIVYRPIEINDHPVILASFFGKDWVLFKNPNNGYSADPVQVPESPKI